MTTRYESISRLCALASMVVSIIAAVICFSGTGISTQHIIGWIAIGLALLAAALVA